MAIDPNGPRIIALGVALIVLGLVLQLVAAFN